MVRPIKPNCCSRLKRTRTETTTFKRAGNQLTGDRESKLSITRINARNENHHQRDANMEYQI
jgi:hypothetical protein